MIRKCTVGSPGNLAGTTAGTYIYHGQTCFVFFLSFVNRVISTVVSRLHLLRRRGTRTTTASSSNLSSDLSTRAVGAALRKNPYLQYRTGLSRDCAIKCSIVRVHRRKCAKAETSEDSRAPPPSAYTTDIRVFGRIVHRPLENTLIYPHPIHANYPHIFHSL